MVKIFTDLKFDKNTELFSCMRKEYVVELIRGTKL